MFSFNARGKLAKSLVYLGWKGLDVVRSYVIPANPDTQPQRDQRGYFRDCIDKIHAVMALAAHALTAADKAAYAALASTRATPRTWFNEIVKLWADCKVAATSPIVYSDAEVTAAAAAALSLIMYLNEETPDDLDAGKFYFGTSKTSLIYAKAATLVSHVSVALDTEDCSAFLTAGNKYYFQFRPDTADPCEGAVSGIYSFIAE